MADQLANITMYKTAFIQARASTEHRVVLEATKFPDNDSNRCLEESQDEKQELQGPAVNPRSLVILRQGSAQRGSDVRGLLLPNI